MKTSYVFIFPRGQPHITKLSHVFSSLSCPPHMLRSEEGYTWLEHPTVNREDDGSINLPLFRTFDQFVDPHCACVFFEETIKAVIPFYVVSMQGEGKGPKLGNCKIICRGLSKYREKTLQINHSYISHRQGCFVLNIIRH